MTWQEEVLYLVQQMSEAEREAYLEHLRALATEGGVQHDQ